MGVAGTEQGVKAGRGRASVSNSKGQEGEEEEEEEKAKRAPRSHVFPQFLTRPTSAIPNPAKCSFRLFAVQPVDWPTALHVTFLQSIDSIPRKKVCAKAKGRERHDNVIRIIFALSRQTPLQ